MRWRLSLLLDVKLQWKRLHVLKYVNEIESVVNLSLNLWLYCIVLVLNLVYIILTILEIEDCLDFLT